MVTQARAEKIEKVVASRQQAIVVLEDIHDPHNAQAVIRSCDCFGVQTIYMVFEKEKQFNPVKMGKLASSSANKWVDYKCFDSTQACYQELKELGYISYATVIDDSALSIYEADFAKANEKLAIWFGNEHAGLSEQAQQLADYLLTIPMTGMIQSLNLSVTAAITLFELSRQRQSVGFDKFCLDTESSDQLLKSFLER